MSVYLMQFFAALWVYQPFPPHIGTNLASLFLIWLLCWRWRTPSCAVLLFLYATLQRNLTDVEDVKFVINFDYPNNSEDYIHRIGRTARSQKTGTAYTFFTPNNMRQASDLISVLREANQAINPKLLQMAEDRGGKSNW